MKTQPLSWEEWKSELQRAGGDSYGPKGPLGCGEECWRKQYDEGESPADAIAEDMDQWEE